MSVNDLETEMDFWHVSKDWKGNWLHGWISNFAEHFQRALGQKQDKANVLQIKITDSPILVNKIR